jgi:hypothetical protein
MKPLLPAIFLLITSATILGVTHKTIKKQECRQKICCMKKCNKMEKKNVRTDYIFWDPIGRLMMIP